MPHVNMYVCMYVYLLTYIHVSWLVILTATVAMSRHLNVTDT